MTSTIVHEDHRVSNLFFKEINFHLLSRDRKVTNRRPLSSFLFFFALFFFFSFASLRLFDWMRILFFPIIERSSCGRRAPPQFFRPPRRTADIVVHISARGVSTTLVPLCSLPPILSATLFTDHFFLFKSRGVQVRV